MRQEFATSAEKPMLMRRALCNKRGPLLLHLATLVIAVT